MEEKSRGTPRSCPRPGQAGDFSHRENLQVVKCLGAERSSSKSQSHEGSVLQSLNVTSMKVIKQWEKSTNNVK